MNEWITSIQPPGLMKMRLMHHQEHHLGHQAPQKEGRKEALHLFQPPRAD